jgi:hypothetical protein
MDAQSAAPLSDEGRSTLHDVSGCDAICSFRHQSGRADLSVSLLSFDHIVSGTSHGSARPRRDGIKRNQLSVLSRPSKCATTLIHAKENATD